jgi:alkylated DNA nucleotide flippase Atl1
VAALIGRGEWTTYGDIARVALGRRSARVVGGAAARGRLANAHRILLAGGRISPGWDGGRVDECRRRLEAEGIRFAGGRADPARHLTWLDLASRFETPATLRS